LLDKYSESADLKEAQKLNLGKILDCFPKQDCLADPNLMVKWSHENNIKVIPING
jgi:16S rRNA (cytidine1402-2'-O)-methyltransferase